VLGGPRLSKRQYSVMLDSRELREKIVAKFDLVHLYKYDKRRTGLDLTLRKLQKRLTMVEEEEGGLGITDVLGVSIFAIARDPKRAAEMANYAYQLLEQKVIELNRKENADIQRFVEEQVGSCEEKLVGVRAALKEFRKTNHVYEIPQQVTMVLQAIGTQRAELLSLENEKAFLRTTHAESYNGIAILNQRMSILRDKIGELESKQEADVFPGLSRSLGLSTAHLDLLKEVETYLQLRLILRQQLELARVKAAKDYSGIYLVDPARPAEYKFKPKRALVVLGIVGLYMILMISFLVIRDYYHSLRDTAPEHYARMSEFFGALRLFPRTR
jgi:tyrosine-protein kinase Etk/Wzc